MNEPTRLLQESLMSSGVVTLIGIMKWIFGDEFGVAMIILVLPPFVVIGF